MPEPACLATFLMLKHTGEATELCASCIDIFYKSYKAFALMTTALSRSKHFNHQSSALKTYL